jgi:hypothetical protein
MRQSIEIFKTHRFKNYFYTYLYSMLKLVVLNNLLVMSRRKNLGDRTVGKVAAYLASARKYVSLLRGSRLYLTALVALVHAEISVILFLAACKIRNRLWKKRPF